MTVASKHSAAATAYPARGIEPQAAALAPSEAAEAFYATALQELVDLGLPFLVGGIYAVRVYTGIQRPTKDLDILCKSGDLPRILGHFQNRSAEIEIEDERWIGKVRHDGCFFDLIFGSANGTMPVTDAWFEQAQRTEILGVPVLLASPTDMIWSKAFVQLRHRFDGPDIMHIILRQHDRIEWRRLPSTMEPYWEILLAHLVNFRWTYPSERDVVPHWLMQEFLERLRTQLELPPLSAASAAVRSCRASIIRWMHRNGGSAVCLKPECEGECGRSREAADRSHWRHSCETGRDRALSRSLCGNVA